MQNLVLNVNFGRSKANATGSSGVGYTLLLSDGSTSVARTTAGVVQVASGSGIYSANVSLPDQFKGQILWDTGVVFSETYFATEACNYESHNPRVDVIHDIVQQVTGTLAYIRGLTAGRWKIDNNHMMFYDEDNTTLLARYALYDVTGTLGSDNVFERVKVP